MTFDDLGGVPERSSVPHDSALERIIELGQECSSNASFRSIPGKEEYDVILERIAEVDVSPELIQQYICTQKDREVSRLQAIYRGMYTGALLHRLAMRRPDEWVLIDGLGATFDFLFCFAAIAPPLIVMNTKGSHLCWKLGSARGACLTLIDTEGDCPALFSGDGGDSSLVFVNESRNPMMLSGLGSNLRDPRSSKRFGILGYAPTGAVCEHHPGGVFGNVYSELSTAIFNRGYPQYEPLTAASLASIALLRSCREDPLRIAPQLHDIARSFL